MSPKCSMSQFLTVDQVQYTLSYSMCMEIIIIIILCMFLCAFYFSFPSGVESLYGGGIGDLSGRLSDLSIASGVSSEASGSLIGGGAGDREGTMRHEEASYRTHCCRSCKNFIDPGLLCLYYM